MKTGIYISMAFVAVALLGASCTKAEPESKTPVQQKVYKVVAHRGGYQESSLPACCLQGLTYSHAIGCYAAECDIVITKDGYALVAHPDDAGKVNGLIPYTSTLEQIRAAGKLKNGEQIPTIEDFVAFLTNSSKNTKGMKIWIDTKAWSDTGLTIKAINAAYEVIKANNAYQYCEFIIPNSGDLFAKVKTTDLFKDGKCYIGWMADGPAKLLDPASFTETTWHQVKYSAIIPGQDIVTPKYSVEQYLQAGKYLSIWCCSTESGEDTNLLTPAMQYYDDTHFKAFFVNYPAAAIKKLKAAGK